MILSEGGVTMNLSLGNTIYELRKQKGLTQEQLAHLLNISKAAVSKWENNLSYPDISLLKPLARTLEISVDELLNYQASLSNDEINDIKKKISSLYETKKIDEAIQLSEDYMKEYPTDYTLKFQIGSLYLRYAAAKTNDEFAKKQLERAKEIFEETIKSNDQTIHDASIHMLISLYSSEDELDKAFALLDKLPTIYQDQRMLKSSILYQKGDVVESIKLDQSCIWSELQNMSLNLLSLANKTAKQDHYENAILILDQCFQLYKALEVDQLLTIGINHYILKMELLIKSNRIEEAKSILTLLLELYEQSQYLPQQDHLLFHLIAKSLKMNISKSYMDHNLLQLLEQNDQLLAIKDTVEYKTLIKKISS